MGKPTYIGLLNSIAVNEAKGQIYLDAWADATPDEQLARVLRFVAVREGEHAWAFTKRLCELGYDICEEDAFQVFRDFEGLMKCVTSDASDAEKIAYVQSLFPRDGGDPFKRFFDDETIDPTTGALLGRYIAEERDSGRRLREAYDRVLTRANGADVETGTPLDEVRELKAALKALRKEVKALKRQVA